MTWILGGARQWFLLVVKVIFAVCYMWGILGTSLKTPLPYQRIPKNSKPSNIITIDGHWEHHGPVRLPVSRIFLERLDFQRSVSKEQFKKLVRWGRWWLKDPDFFPYIYWMSVVMLLIEIPGDMFYVFFLKYEGIISMISLCWYLGVNVYNTIWYV